MSTATVNTTPVAAEARHIQIFRRFIWKEFRMLRGLWLALLVMGAMMQWTVQALAPYSLDHALMLFSVALGATVLYAVGAASTSFSVEHEDETYDFLAGLPATWLPLFTGKLAVVVASAVALAVCLSIAGWMLSGFETPAGNGTALAIGFLGVAVLEAIAWGTVFSLWVQRPLIAAILTVVVGAVVVNVLVSLSSSYPVASTNPAAYLEAAPLRLVVTAVVLLAGGMIARRWLATDKADTAGRGATLGPWQRIRFRMAARLRPEARSTSQASRRMLLARLVWQTWREGRKLLLAPLGVALLLLLGMTAVATLATILGSLPQFVPVGLTCTVFFVPALYGAMAFSADQRRGRYRFLAEHAARPRYVWLARHIVWLGTLAVVAAAIFLLVLALLSVAWRFNAANTLENYLRWGVQAPEMNYRVIEAIRIGTQGTTLAAIGMLAAYGIGQLSSMLVRSEILASFLAIVLSTFLSVWIALVFAWQLSGWLFVFPLAAGLMLATWLRAPDWIESRNSWRSWIKPALAVVAAVTFVAVALPSARLQQIRNRPVSITHLNSRPADADSTIPSSSEFDTPEARETADDYVKVATRLAAGPKENFLARWESPGREWTPGGFLEGTIPADELDEFREAEKKQLTLQRALIRESVATAIEISKRPECYFHLNVGWVAPNRRDRGSAGGMAIDQYVLYADLKSLQYHVLFAPQIEQNLIGNADEHEPAEENPHNLIERALAALRISAHLTAGQTSVVWSDQQREEQRILQTIAQWALDDGRTREELESALVQLTKHFRLWGSLQEALYADHRLITHVLTGMESSLAFLQQPDSLAVQLAATLNELPWERQRALEALAEITRQNVADADELEQYIGRSTPNELGNTWLRRWLRQSAQNPADWPANWVLARPAVTTSFLASFEYAARTPVHELYRQYCDRGVCRQAALVQIALAMYRLDHGEYPARLSELVPAYLELLPMDPYAGQPFQYEATGLDLPLVHWSAFSNFHQIDANKPFLWSVGPGNARLTWWRRDRPEPRDAEQTGQEREPVIEHVYILATEEQLWRNEPALAFPLGAANPISDRPKQTGQ
jgi:ABC-type transport system involved in multi-copper enzyme maturation permease subunit